MPHNRDFTEAEEKAFFNALQVLEDEEFIEHGEKIPIWQFVDSAHYVTRPERGGPFKATLEKDQASVDPFTGTEHAQQPKKIGRKN